MGRMKGAKGRKSKSAVAGKRGAKGAPQKPSGAAYRRQRKERESAERVTNENETGEHQKLRTTIGDLPLDDVETAMPWFRRAQIVLLGEMMKDPTVSIREQPMIHLPKRRTRVKVWPDPKRLVPAQPSEIGIMISALQDVIDGCGAQSDCRRGYAAAVAEVAPATSTSTSCPWRSRRAASHRRTT
jgi:hypothetical protein